RQRVLPAIVLNARLTRAKVSRWLPRHMALRKTDERRATEAAHSSGDKRRLAEGSQGFSWSEPVGRGGSGDFACRVRQLDLLRIPRAAHRGTVACEVAVGQCFRSCRVLPFRRPLSAPTPTAVRRPPPEPVRRERSKRRWLCWSGVAYSPSSAVSS